MSQQRKKAITCIRQESRQKVLAELDSEDYEEALLDAHGNPRISVDGGALGAEAGGAPHSHVHAHSGNGVTLIPGRPRASVTGDRTFSRTSMLSQVAPKWFVKDYLAMKEIILSSYVNLLLVCIPLGIASGVLGWGAVLTFTLNLLALIPLALILGDVTEDLAVRFGDVVGGLINATFGNVVEVMVSLFALFKNLFTVVSASLLGSILSNLLLVMGMSFFLGGLFHSVQTFNAVSNRACSSLLTLACIGILIPSAASKMVDDPDTRADWVLDVSRGTAVIMLVMYGCYLLFQLKTHAHLFIDEEDEAEPMLTLGTSIGALTVITAIVALCSEFLTSSIEEVSEHTGLSESFIGMIILPIAGNACEHMTACIVATRNKMDLSMGVAVGSSIQIALFAVPFTVVVGWIFGHPFSLDFSPFAAMVLVVAVIQANFATSDATSHWLMGVQLMALYALIAIAYYNF